MRQLPSTADILIKICGLSTPETLDAAIDAGADMVGLVRFAKSPRNVSLEQGAALSARAKGRTTRVALVVDAGDDEISDIMRVIAPDMLQLHGHETPERVAHIRAKTNLPVMKAIGIANQADLAQIALYRDVASLILLDAKPPKDADLPGGNGLPFDWRLLATLDPTLPFMLSGGLTPDNVAAAVPLIARPERPSIGLDVSSGVESLPGVKDAARIEAFVAAARAAFAALPRGVQAGSNKTKATTA